MIILCDSCIYFISIYIPSVAFPEIKTYATQIRNRANKNRAVII